MCRPNLRLIRFSVLALLAIGLGVLVLHRLNTGRVADALLFQARNAEQQGQHEKAIRFWNEYLDYRPHDADARAELGYALSETAGDSNRKALERAYFNLERVLTQEPGRDDARRRLVQVTLELERFDKAEEHLSILRQAHPDDVELALLQGRLREARGEFEQAVAAYRLAIRQAPHQLDSYERLARLLRAKPGALTDSGQDSEADACMKAMIETNPTSAKAQIAMYRYLVKHGAADDSALLQQAIACVKFAEERAPNDVEVILAGGESALALGDLDQARANFEKGLRLYPKDRRFHQAMAALEATVGNHVGAIQHLQASLPLLAPADQPAVLFDLAELLIDTGDLAAAEAIVTRLRQSHAEPATIEFLEGRVDIYKGRWSEAAGRLEHVAAVKDRPELAKRADRYLADCYTRLGDDNGQLAVWKRIVAREPKSVAARMRLAAFYTSADRTDDAIGEYRHIVSLPNVPIAAWNDLVRLLLAKGDLRDAEVVVQHAENAKLPFNEIALMRSELLITMREWQRAKGLLEQAKEREPKDVHVRLALVALAERQNQVVEARRILEEAERDLGDLIDVRLGWVQFWENHPGTDANVALERLGDGIEAFPKEGRARLLSVLAVAQAKLGNLEAAERLWDALTRQPDYELRLPIRRRLFEIALERSDETGVQRRLDDIERIEAGRGPVWQLCEIERLVRSARRGNPELLATARELAEALSAEHPDWPAVTAARGEIEDVAGNYEAAGVLYRHAITLGERRDRIVKRLLDLLRQQNRTDGADEIRRMLGKPTTNGNESRD